MVLILIVMEHALGDLNGRAQRIVMVLILIVMEHALGEKL